jgi:ABC-type sugar transport system substrate-binding protein
VLEDDGPVPHKADEAPAEPTEGLSRRSILKRSAGMVTVGGVTPLIVAACGGGDATKPGSAAAQTSTTDRGVQGGSQTTQAYDSTRGVDPKSLGKKTVGVMPIALAPQPSKRIVAGLQKEADKAGWKVLVTDPNGDLNKAAAAWQNYLQAGVDGLVTSAFDPELWKPQIKAAQSKKTPYISLFSNWGPGVTAVITADAYLEGAALASFVIDRTGGEGGVIAFGSKVAPALTSRWKAFQAHLAANSNMKVLEYHEIDLAKIQQDVFSGMQAYLQKYPKGQIAAVFGAFTGPALSAAQACKAAGRKEIACVGTDGDKEALAAIRKGDDPFAATTGFNFEACGANALRQMAAVMSGKQALGHQIYQESPVVVQSNVTDGGYYAASPQMTTYTPPA